MDLTTVLLMLFPAFLIGASFGLLVVLVLAGNAKVNNLRALVFSALGSAAGIGVFHFTQAWWPPVIGPFVICPPLAALSAVLSRQVR